MKFLTLLLIAFLLPLTACAPGTISPEPTQSVPPPVSATPGMPATSTPVGVPTCTCPTGIPATVPPGSANPMIIVCNCPVIPISPPIVVTAVSGGTSLPATVIAPPPILPTEGGPSPSPPPADGVTLADNNETFTMQVGDIFLLNLGMDIYDWSVDVDNQDVLGRVPNVMVIRGAQGLYRAHAPGTAALTATGDPRCRQSKPACMMPSILFRITVIVR